MPKGIPNKRYTPEIKKHVIETMLEEMLAPGVHSQFGSGKHSQFKPER